MRVSQVGNSKAVAHPSKVMNKLAPVLLPAILGLMAGISHGMAAHIMETPGSFDETFSNSFQMGQPLRD